MYRYKKYSYKGYLNKMVADISDYSENVKHIKYSDNLETYILSGNDYEVTVVKSGNYLTYRFKEISEYGEYTAFFLYRLFNGNYGLIEYLEIVHHYHDNYRHSQGYRTEYMLNRANNITAKILPCDEYDYKKYSWNDWQKVYKEKIDKCLIVGTLFPNSDNPREIIFNGLGNF